MTPRIALPAVQDVLALEALAPGNPRVVAGRGGLRRSVRWTHVVEVTDVARLLSGGELLLTTGAAFPDDPSAMAGWINELASVPISGMIVELGRRFHRVPRALLVAADEADIPVIALEHEVRFVNITEQVHAQIVDVQVSELRASEQLHSTFTELSIEGASPAEILRHTSRISGLPVVLENLAHQVLAHDAGPRNPGEVLSDWESRSRAVRLRTRTGVDEEHGWSLTTVGARGHDWGRLILINGPEGPNATDLMLLERAAATLALNRLVERDRDSLERQGHRTLLTAIATHTMSSTEVQLRAAALGVPIEGRTLVAAVVRARGNGTPAGALDAQAHLRDAAETVAGALRGTRTAALVGSLDEEAIGVLISLGGRENVDTALARIGAELTRRLGEEFVVGVGSDVASVADARRSLLEAAQVAQAAELQSPTRTIYRLPDVRLRGLLHLLRDDDRLQTYVERELGALLAYDSKNGTDLLGLLRIYLTEGRNKSSAAAAAHLSRPSMYERLQRIEAIIGVDLDSVESCLSLHVAVVALEAVRRQHTPA